MGITCDWVVSSLWNSVCSTAENGVFVSNQLDEISIKYMDLIYILRNQIFLLNRITFI